MVGMLASSMVDREFEHKPKTIKLVLATAPFIIYIALRSMNKNWRLRNRIMCLSGETYLLTECFYCELAIKIQLSMLVKYKVRIINISLKCKAFSP